nr:MAG TPA_asm: hypothetical protein [Caudoviricetes sp.]
MNICSPLPITPLLRLVILLNTLVFTAHFRCSLRRCIKNIPKP